MKKMVLIMFVLACVARAEDVVQVTAAPDGNGGAEVRAGVDLFAFTQAGRERRAQRRAETRARRENMTIPERAGDHFRHNWKKYAAAGAVFAVDRYAYNNAELYYKWLGLRSRTGGGDRTGDDATVIVDISGNNNNVVIQIPAGSGAGMSGSAGAGGQGNSSESTTSTTGF